MAAADAAYNESGAQAAAKELVARPVHGVPERRVRVCVEMVANDGEDRDIYKVGLACKTSQCD